MLKLTADNKDNGTKEAHDTHALDHHHEIGVSGGVCQDCHDEARHEKREAEVCKDEQRHLTHSRLRKGTAVTHLYTIGFRTIVCGEHSAMATLFLNLCPVPLNLALKPDSKKIF